MMTIRAAGPDDAQSLYDWRNEPHTRAASGSTDPIEWEDHRAWFTRSLVSPTRSILIAEDDAGESIGMVRFDLDGVGAEVSINLNPAFRGRGLGAEVLRVGIDAFNLGSPERPLRAVIRASNAASIRTFETVGFERESETDGLLTYRRLTG